MPAPLSVIIPTLNVADRIAPTLAALAEGAGDGLIQEVIFADGGSTDDIAALADGVGAALIDAPRGRGAQLGAGAAAARGDWMLFLHADTVLEGDWIAAIRRHMTSAPEAAGCFRLAFDATGRAPRIVAGWANLRTAWFGVPYGDQGLLISRALYASIGGYPAQPLMEDVAIVRALGRRRIRLLDAVTRTGAERYERDGWTRRSVRNFFCLSAYLLGVSPARIAAWYAR